MSESEALSSEDNSIKDQIASEINEAKGIASSLRWDDVKNGDWFLNLLRRVVGAYDRNARATYFQQKYPGLPPDEISDILISVTVRYAAIAGAIAGAAITANEIATLASSGMTAALLVTAIGAEMIYLARIQMRLVLDLSVVYDLQLDADDPEDILMVLGYAIGVAPTDLAGKGLQIAAASLTKGAIREYISKSTLRAIQDFARRLGFRILQRTILKYAVPFAGAAVGSIYNYLTTQAVGKAAKSHFKHRGEVSEELRLLLSRQNTYDIVFPAAILYMAQADGFFSSKEKELYRAMLSRMSFDEHTQTEFQRLLATEENLIDAVNTQLQDAETKRVLLDVLALMAIYDGKLADEEKEFLAKTAARLDIKLDLADIEQRTQDYSLIAKENLLQKTTRKLRRKAKSSGENFNKAT